jgi:hypothetical protein
MFYTVFWTGKTVRREVNEQLIECSFVRTSAIIRNRMVAMSYHPPKVLLRAKFDFMCMLILDPTDPSKKIHVFAVPP